MDLNAPNTLLIRLTFLSDVPQIRLSDGFDSGVCHFLSIDQASYCGGFFGRRSICKDTTATKKVRVLSTKVARVEGGNGSDKNGGGNGWDEASIWVEMEVVSFDKG
ncbi:hypothetical protein V6N12_012811 [Hibiscus sabdariffa]|uniref:Uncharacterized protein n=1 Tax=Hibiscus sabdariffa TaxID=183260 RepID=A0ABR2EFG6_9ROSI